MESPLHDRPPLAVHVPVGRQQTVAKQPPGARERGPFREQVIRAEDPVDVRGAAEQERIVAADPERYDVAARSKPLEKCERRAQCATRGPGENGRRNISDLLRGGDAFGHCTRS
jgi:hypothetical protein